MLVVKVIVDHVGKSIKSSDQISNVFLILLTVARSGACSAIGLIVVVKSSVRSLTNWLD